MLDSRNNQKTRFFVNSLWRPCVLLASYRARITIINTIRQRQYQTWYGAVLVFKLNVSGNVVNVMRADLPLIQRLLAL